MCLIFDLTLWRLKGVTLHEYLLVFDPEILITHNCRSDPTKTEQSMESTNHTKTKHSKGTY